MGFNLLYCVKGNADNDKQGSASKVKRNVELLNQYPRQHADKGYVKGAGKGDPRHDLLYVFCSLLSRPYTGYVTTVLLHVVRDVIRVEHDGGIEETEEYDEGHVERLVRMLPGVRSSENFFMYGWWIKPPIVAGNMRMDDAKIGGITPAGFTFRGRWVDCRRTFFFLLLALRLYRDPSLGCLHVDDEGDYHDHHAVMSITTNQFISPVFTRLNVPASAFGNLATIPANIMSDIPLPMPSP